MPCDCQNVRNSVVERFAACVCVIKNIVVQLQTIWNWSESPMTTVRTDDNSLNWRIVLIQKILFLDSAVFTR
eukprot:8818058-Karenia_brevis.AAC.1